MPFLTTNSYGSGARYTFAAGDPSAWLLEDVYFYQTSTSGFAVDMSIANANFTVSGSIGSRGVGIRAGGSGTTRIEVTASGYVSGDSIAINVTTDQTFFLLNAGTIESATGIAIRASSISGTPTGPMTIINNGLIQVGSGMSAIQTGGGNDRITNTGTISGSIFLGDGADRIDMHLGIVVGIISGGAGSDTYIIAGTELISEQADEGNDRVFSYSDYSLASNGQNLEELNLLGTARVGGGNALDNDIFGNDLGNILSGGGGNDLVYAGLGNDTLYGNGGDDRLDGSDGDNLLFGGGGNDFLEVASGTNSLNGGSGDDILQGGSDADTLNGGSGFDIASFFTNTAAIVANLTTLTVNGGEADGDKLTSIEGIYATNFADEVTGSAKDNLLLGLSGQDALFGLGGDDRLEGGVGADQLDGGLDIDTAEYRLSVLGVTVDLASGQGTSGDALGDTLIGIENVTGSNGADAITGDDAANVLRGGGASDVLSGGKGADTLYGEAGDDTLTGGGQADTFGFSDIVAGAPGGWGDDTIAAFQDGLDRISFVGASAVGGFGDLVVTADGADTLITVDLDVIRLINFTPANLNAADFVFG